MSAGTLRVATYNVHDCIGRDGAYAPDRVAAVIAGLRADVVALQEITLDHAGDVVQLLEQTTGMNTIDGTLFERGTGRYGNVLLSRQPVIEQRLHDLSFGEREPRGLVDADVLHDGRRWRVLATHLGLSWRERRRQLARVARLLSQDTRPTTVLGDFNIWLGSRAFAPLARLGYVQRKVRSYPTWFAPLLSLDRVLLRPPVRFLRCERFDSATARIASDHYPVIADLVVDDDEM